MMPNPLARTASETQMTTDEQIAAREKQIKALELELEDFATLVADGDMMSDLVIARSALEAKETLERQIRVQHFLLAEAKTRKSTLDDVANGKKAL